MASSTDAPPTDGLELRPLEQAILVQEIAPFAAMLKEPVGRERYARLDAAARAGLVPADLVPALEAMLELILQTRRIRQRHGHEADQAIRHLFARTPRGASLKQAATEANTALETLRGHVLENLTITAGPGRHTLVVTTERCRLTLKLDAAGAQIENVELGG